MLIDLPSPRAASGSFFEPNSKMIMIATTSRCQGSSPLRSMPQVPSPYSWLPACATVQPQTPSPPHSSESFLFGAAAYACSGVIATPLRETVLYGLTLAQVLASSAVWACALETAAFVSAGAGED